MARGVSPDLVGQTFGILTVLSKLPCHKPGNVKWLCSCTCGGYRRISTVNIMRGRTKLCSCKRRPRGILHPAARSPEYRAYLAAKNRCKSKLNPAYKNYGSRGIKFLFTCFDEFFEEIGARPSSKHSLDRINNDGNYEKGNIRWATRDQQLKNRRKFTVVNNFTDYELLSELSRRGFAVVTNAVAA